MLYRLRGRLARRRRARQWRNLTDFERAIVDQVENDIAVEMREKFIVGDGTGQPRGFLGDL